MTMDQSNQGNQNTNEENEGEAGKRVAHKLFKANMKLVYLDNISQGVVSAIDILQKFIVIVVAVILLVKLILQCGWHFSFLHRIYFQM